MLKCPPGSHLLIWKPRRPRSWPPLLGLPFLGGGERTQATKSSVSMASPNSRLDRVLTAHGGRAAIRSDGHATLVQFLLAAAGADETRGTDLRDTAIVLLANRPAAVVPAIERIARSHALECDDGVESTCHRGLKNVWARSWRFVSAFMPAAAHAQGRKPNILVIMVTTIEKPRLGRPGGLVNLYGAAAWQ